MEHLPAVIEPELGFGIGGRNGKAAIAHAGLNEDAAIFVLGLGARFHPANGGKSGQRLVGEGYVGFRLVGRLAGQRHKPGKRGTGNCA